MANISFTAGNVALGSASTRDQRGQAGEALAQGQPIYLNSSDGKWYQTDADVQASSDAGGIVLTPAATDGYFKYIIPGSGAKIIFGTSVFTQGVPYYVSTTKGAICEYGDLASGDYVKFLGVAASTTTLNYDSSPAIVVKP
jgi:hypothetical protein